VTVSRQRIAWAAFAVICVLYVVALILNLPVSDDTNNSDWGISGAVSGSAFVLATFLFALVGVLVATRQPRNAVGWILLGIGGVWGFDLVCSTYGQYGLQLHRGSHELARVAAAVDAMMWVPAIGLMGVFLLLLFPDGHLLTPRWRWLAWPTGVGLVIASLTILFDAGTMTGSTFPNTVNPLGIEALDGLFGYLRPAVIVLPVAIVGAAVSLVLRYRRSRGVERLQMKWLAFAAAAVACIYAVAMLATALTPSDAQRPGWVAVVQTLALVSFGLIPVSIGFAVFQYRLYDIDLIIRRTLTYSCLATVLIAIYLLGVVGLSGLLRALTGESGALAVTLSTLVVVVVSRPILSRIKRVVDHRFARASYDAGRTIDEFSRQVRQKVDLDALGSELVGAVATTVQPSHVTLWLRPPEAR
jgi:hypothetical protein